MTSYYTAQSADGPGLYEWLQRKGLLELVNQNDVEGRTARRWREGAMAEFDVVDAILTRIHLHPLDLPDVLWREQRANQGPKIERRCKRCSRVFVTTHSSSRMFCSESCQVRAKRVPRVSVCGWCGKRLVQTHGGSLKKWCSPYCKSTGTRKKAA